MQTAMRPILFLLSTLSVAACSSPKLAAPTTDSHAPAVHPSSVVARAFREDNVRKGCPPEGNAKPDSVKALNVLKNRIEAPGNGDIDATVTLRALLQPGDDEERWDESKGGAVVGYVHDVKIGGVETANCKAADKTDRDTHIELVTGPDRDGKTQRVIVEVTPRWRDMMEAKNVDWSTDGLKAQLVGQTARFRGWLLFDGEHVNQAEKTNPGGDRNWRATAWEIHPITQIECLDC